NYRTLEDDEHPYVYLDDGWRWLDDNVAWAKAHGVYLILNMHVPQGGFQSLGKGWDLWDKPENQQRLIALWKAIASRYKDQPVIFGYDLVNEPGVSTNRTQWQQLAQQLVGAIREVDSKHPVIVERVNSIHGEWINDDSMNFVTVNDKNVIYEFHIYDPYFYTHQHIAWDEKMRNRDGGVWPDAANNHTRKFLSDTVDQYLVWGTKHQVPLYLGEWGVYKANFENDRGGLNWIKDMIAVINQRKITNTYHVYHEESFGIYRGDGKIDPQNANQELINVFKEEYKK
ncbi:MAG: cellulase family glycosylhydrolase, partial [Steroidobacter sp.]